MAYIDRTTGGNQRIATIAVVAVIQGAAIVALINGLAVTWTQTAVIPNPKATDVPITMPIDPPPPPPDKPTIEPRTPIDNPQPRLPMPVPVEPYRPPITQPMTDPTPTTSLDPPRPPLPQPTPTFTPRDAKLRNAPGAWATPNDYPARDLREGNQGVTGFLLTIGADGRVQSCAITRSSGFAGLDKATCDNVSRRARFDAATDGAGNRTAGSYKGTISWRIPQD
jgi:protein TonB